MGFPEGKSDWAKIMHFIIVLIRAIGEVFIGDNPDHGESNGK